MRVKLSEFLSGLKSWEKAYIVSVTVALFSLGFVAGEASELKLGLLACIPPFLLFLLASLLAIFDNSDKGF